MGTDNLREQLTKYLADVHSVEKQAGIQMRAAPRMAGDRQIGAVFAAHLTETQAHERLVTERLRALDAKPSPLKDALGTLTGLGFGAFAMAQPDTPGKLLVHAFSYEHMEEAAYDLLARVADRAGDDPTAQVARTIEQQERTMAERLAGCFDLAARATLDEKSPDGLSEQLNKYLADAHAIEQQSLVLLSRASRLAETSELTSIYANHRAETEEHKRLLEARLKAREASPSRLKDGALALGALSWGVFFQAQPDTPVKLAGFAYAFEHLEAGAYEMLKRVADRAGDAQTSETAARILAEEHAAADRIRSQFDRALDAALTS